MNKEVLQDALELLAVATFITPKLQAKRTDVINTGLNVLAAQPAQQEPVAWMDKEVGAAYLASELNANDDCAGLQPLYTAPPQRKPLTDEEISDIWCEVSNTDFVTADTHEFARAIEAKLKGKNT